MGLFDKIKAAYQPELPDQRAAIMQASDGAEVPLVTARVIAAAYMRGGHGGGFEGQIVSRVMSAAQNAVAGAKHVGGDAHSIAKQLDRSGDMRVLCLGETNVTWWDFGMTGTEATGTLVARLPRANVASIADTRKKAFGGGQLVRFTFSDESFADFQVVSPPDNFWTVAATYGR